MVDLQEWGVTSLPNHEGVIYYCLKIFCNTSACVEATCISS